jgi:sulfoxide reductase heme-binding subunit YedZ
MQAWTSGASTEPSSVRPAAAASYAARASSARRRVDAALRHRAVKPIAFALALLPFVHLLWGAIADALGPNPAEALIRQSGDWTLRLLCLTLAVTPLRQWTNWHALARLRRMLGLFTFFYGLLHFLCFAWLDMGFDVDAILRDIAKRPFILVGASALLLMTPLAATSFDRAVRALGAARWQALHRAAYAIAALALLHFFWMRAGKNDFAEWSVYAAVIGVLLGWRLLRRLRGRVTS